MEDVATYIQFGAWASLFAGIATPNIINLFKNVGFEWPDWFKLTVSIVGAAVASLAAVAVSAGLDVVQVWPPDWSGFVAPLLAGMAVTYPVQLTAWQNLWKTTTAGEFVSSLGTGHP